MAAEKNPLDLTLDEKRERLEADVLAWQEEGVALDKRDQAFAAKYGVINSHLDLSSLPPEGQREWTEIYRAQREHLERGKTLQMISHIVEKESRLPGIGGFIGRLFGRGRRPGSYKSSDGV